MPTGVIVKNKSRRVIHVVAGNENWDPSQEEMQQITNLFSDAFNDPKGAVVVTRDGVHVDCIIDQEDQKYGSDREKES